MRGFFANKGEQITDDLPEQNEVIARIEISKKGVKSLLIRCHDSKTIYKAEYSTSKSNIFAYHEAVETLKKHSQQEGFEIVNISTNIDLPYVKTASRRTR